MKDQALVILFMALILATFTALSALLWSLAQ